MCFGVSRQESCRFLHRLQRLCMLPLQQEHHAERLPANSILRKMGRQLPCKGFSFGVSSLLEQNQQHPHRVCRFRGRSFLRFLFHPFSVPHMARLTCPEPIVPPLE